MNEAELNDYDNIINNLHNEWDLYYWLTNARPIPDELKNSKIIQLMKEYCANDKKQSRLVLPDLPDMQQKL
jgi:succinate dehydrogenase assembly factor 2